MPLYAVMPAAGRSRRMGKCKYTLFVYNNKTVIECAIENILLSGILDIFVVLNGEDAVVKAVSTYNVRICQNDNEHSYMADSIRIALNKISIDNPNMDEKTGIMIALADQPVIKSATIKKIIDIYAADPKKIVIPTFKGRRGHPTIFPYYIIKDLSEMETLRDVIGKHEDKILLLETDDEGIILDIDTPGDYEYVMEYIKSKEVFVKN